MARKKHWFLFSSLAFFVIYLSFLSAGYGVTACVYHWLQRPPEMLAHVLSGMVGFLLMVAVFSALRPVFMRNHFEKDNREDFYGSLLTALDQIAHGNFNVLVTPHDRGPYNELAGAVNEMAKNLGTLETLRQDFISNISHEIQSPLTSIGGFAVLLQDDTLNEEQRCHYAAIIKSESERLSRMSENLLKLSTLESGGNTLASHAFRLDKQLEQVILTLEPQWSAKNLLPEAALTRAVYTGDEALLSQVWINLIGNAIKFTPEAGQIVVTLTQEGDFCRVDIRDTGIGIDAESQMHIFERFYKADKSRDRALGGNGLGLSLVKKIVELHGGRVTVESTPGQGTVFRVFLPMAR